MHYVIIIPGLGNQPPRPLGRGVLKCSLSEKVSLVCHDLIIGVMSSHYKAKTFEFATAFWKFFGLIPIVKLFDWRDEKITYEQKFEELNRFIESIDQTGNKISLVGCSAGGSAVINLFCANKEKIHKVINVCGRLSKYNLIGWSNFEERTKASKKFKLSVEKCEENIKGLSSEDKKKILTLYPFFGDEVVPIESMKIDGARSDPLFSFEHMITITLALTVYFYKIRKFLFV